MNKDVTDFIASLHHPLEKEIQALRHLILGAHQNLEESIKWNSPNYSINGEDRITMRVQPPPQLQIIFHRGAKKQPAPKENLLKDPSGLLTWKTTDRAILSLKNGESLTANKTAITTLVKDWIRAAQ